MFLHDGPIDWVARPIKLANVKEAYAAYVVGDCMEPMYFAGQIVGINPFGPLVKGRGVIVIKKNHVVLLKRFVKWTDTHLLLAQLNPAADIDVARDDILEVGRVVWIEDS